MSNDSTMNVEIENNRANKMTKLHSTHIEFTLHYITLTCYYIVKDTFRWQVMTGPQMWKQQWSEQNHKIAFNTLKIYITIHHTYNLLYYKGHI